MGITTELQIDSNFFTDKLKMAYIVLLLQFLPITIMLVGWAERK